MFEQRLRILSLVVGAAMCVVAARLVHLQVLQADVFRQEAQEALLLPPRTLPFVRGQILDRGGRVLAADAPSWDLRLDFGALGAMDAGYIEARALAARKASPGAAVSADDVRVAIEQTWERLATFSGQPQRDLQQRGREIVERIGRIREIVAARRGFDAPVAEEVRAHAIVTGLDDQQQVAARREFADCPWVHVEASNRRTYFDAECLAHVLGRTAVVSAETVASDPEADDPLRCYLADEPVGVGGVEAAAERRLRGARGRLRRDRTGQAIEDVPPVNGQDVRLTLRYDLQRRLYELMAQEVPQVPASTGGSVVVLDVPRREVLALVSYPAYDPNSFSDDFGEMRRDTLNMPLGFRAIANRYVPGSIIKPLTCLAALGNGIITTETTINCTGYLFPDKPSADASKCWEVGDTGERKAHGPVNVVQALTGSCNIFMYTVGQELGVERLCNYFKMFGIGEASGLGLPEENRGINPTPSWLAEVLETPVTQAHPRLFAIGQGELAVTPLQAANLMATYAEGCYRHVRLMLPDAFSERAEAPRWDLPVRPEHWRAIRQGLFGVVNDAEGTAHRYARFQHPRYALCGKTGGATTMPKPLNYRIPYVASDGLETVTVLPAGSKANALHEFRRLHPEATVNPGEVTKLHVWPTVEPASGDRHSHAWFAGYLQELDASGQPKLDRVPEVAFAVLVEYGGAGGQVAGAVGRRIAEALLDVLGEELDPDRGAKAD